jgi:hypothetical protein
MLCSSLIPRSGSGLQNRGPQRLARLLHVLQIAISMADISSTTLPGSCIGHLHLLLLWLRYSRDTGSSPRGLLPADKLTRRLF